MQQLYETWGLANDRAFVPLLQAVGELALEDRQYDERRYVEALATQLKLNRKQVVEEYVNDQLTLQVMETAIFEPASAKVKTQPAGYRAVTKKGK